MLPELHRQEVHPEFLRELIDGTAGAAGHFIGFDTGGITDRFGIDDGSI
jgi:hypothetical protein